MSSIKGSDGKEWSTFEEIEKEVKNHFTHLYKDPKKKTLREALACLSDFRCSISKKKNESLYVPMSKEEVVKTLKSLKVFKAHGLDKSTMVFYLGCWNIPGKDLSAMVEESCQEGKIFVAFNSTFIATITKGENPMSIDSSKPIYFCNVVYKTIAKVLETLLKLVLSYF